MYCGRTVSETDGVLDLRCEYVKVFLDEKVIAESRRIVQDDQSGECVPGPCYFSFTLKETAAIRKSKDTMFSGRKMLLSPVDHNYKIIHTVKGRMVYTEKGSVSLPKTLPYEVFETRKISTRIGSFPGGKLNSAERKETAFRKARESTSFHGH